jgi:hypothetical protein
MSVLVSESGSILNVTPKKSLSVRKYCILWKLDNEVITVLTCKVSIFLNEFLKQIQDPKPCTAVPSFDVLCQYNLSYYVRNVLSSPTFFTSNNSNLAASFPRSSGRVPADPTNSADKEHPVDVSATNARAKPGDLIL